MGISLHAICIPVELLSFSFHGAILIPSSVFVAITIFRSSLRIIEHICNLHAATFSSSIKRQRYIRCHACCHIMDWYCLTAGCDYITQSAPWWSRGVHEAGRIQYTYLDSRWSAVIPSVISYPLSYELKAFKRMATISMILQHGIGGSIGPYNLYYVSLWWSGVKGALPSMIWDYGCVTYSLHESGYVRSNEMMCKRSFMDPLSYTIRIISRLEYWWCTNVRHLDHVQSIVKQVLLCTDMPNRTYRESEKHHGAVRTLGPDRMKNYFRFFSLPGYTWMAQEFRNMWFVASGKDSDTIRYAVYLLQHMAVIFSKELIWLETVEIHENVMEKWYWQDKQSSHNWFC